jgi:hypothetical protein
MGEGLSHVIICPNACMLRPWHRGGSRLPQSGEAVISTRQLHDKPRLHPPDHNKNHYGNKIGSDSSRTPLPHGSSDLAAVIRRLVPVIRLKSQSALVSRSGVSAKYANTRRGLTAVSSAAHTVNLDDARGVRGYCFAAD